MKKMMAIIIPAIILVLFLTYQDSLIVKNLKKDNSPDISPETISGSTIYIPNTDTTIVPQVTIDVSKYSIANNNHVSEQEKLNIQKENDYPDEIKKGELVSIDRLFNVKTKEFYYIGMTCTAYDKGSQMDVCTWEVANRCKYPVRANINITFYDKDKKKIGKYIKEKTLKRVKYDDESETDWQDDAKIDKGQSCSVRMSVDKSVLKKGYTFKDVKFVSLADIPKKGHKNTATPTPTLTPNPSVSLTPKPEMSKEIVSLGTIQENLKKSIHVMLFLSFFQENLIIILKAFVDKMERK